MFEGDFWGETVVEFSHSLGQEPPLDKQRKPDNWAGFFSPYLGCRSGGLTPHPDEHSDSAREPRFVTDLSELIIQVHYRSSRLSVSTKLIRLPVYVLIRVFDLNGVRSVNIRY